MKYFIKIVQTYSPKNKLDKALLEYIQPIDYLLLDKKSLNKRITQLKNEVTKLNNVHFRCSPQTLQEWTDDANTHYRIHCVVQFAVYPAKTINS